MIQLSVSLALGSASLGCVRHYRPPKANEPHAVVKIRRSYSEPAEEKLREAATLDGNLVFETEVDSKLADAPRTDAVLVHPKATTLRLASAFGAYRSRQVQDTEQVPYQASESCSCGSYDSYRTCTRMVTRYRSEIRQRWVTRVVFVPNGQCESAVELAPVVGRTYLLQYPPAQGRASKKRGGWLGPRNLIH